MALVNRKTKAPSKLHIALADAARAWGIDKGTAEKRCERRGVKILTWEGEVKRYILIEDFHRVTDAAIVVNQKNLDLAAKYL